jgi:hypothetical protein
MHAIKEPRPSSLEPDEYQIKAVPGAKVPARRERLRLLGCSM